MEAAIAFFERLPAAITAASHAGVRAGSEIIEREAKREIGHYQPEAGPFQEWEELADSTKRERVAARFPENNPLLRSGELLHSIGTRIEGNHASIGSDSPIAVYQERGTGRIPPRSFLGGAAFRKKDEVAELIATHVVWALRGLPPRND